MSHRWRNFYALIVLGIYLSVLAFGYIYTRMTPALTAPESKVLGDQTIRLFTENNSLGYQSNGILAQSSLSEPSIYLNAYNGSGQARLRLYEATKNDLLTFLTYDNQNQQLNPVLDLNHRSKIFEDSYNLSGKYNSEAARALLPLQNKIGIWLLELELNEQKQQAILVRSSFGVYTVETERDYVFWAQDYATGRSKPNLNLTIYQLHDTIREITNRTLDSEGTQRIEMQEDHDIALIEQSGDLAVAPINLTELNFGYRYNRFTKTNLVNQSFTFTDRPLYKPGDTVYFKSILRNDLDHKYSLPTGNVKVEIIEGYYQGTTVYQTVKTINDIGEISGEYKIPSDISPGNYTMKVSRTINGNEQTAYSYFDINYYRKPEYDVQLISAQKEYIRGDQGTVTVQATYFSGEPVINRTIKYKISASQHYYDWFDSTEQINDDYQYSYYYGNNNIYEGTVTLDNNGQAVIPIDTTKDTKTTYPAIYAVEAELSDNGDNPSFARKNLLVRDATFGIYALDQPYPYSAKPNQQYELKVKAKSYLNDSVANIPLEANVTHTKYVSYQDPNYKYQQYRKEETSILSQQFTTDNQGQSTITFIPPQEGSYTITIQGIDKRGNRTISEFYMYASSMGDYTNLSESKQPITVTTDKKEYQHTDIAKIFVKLNQADRDVLVSLNGRYMDRFQIVHLTGNQGSVEFQLTDTDIPNRVAHALSFSHDQSQSGQAQVYLSTNPKKVQIQLLPDHQTTTPGDTITMNIETRDGENKPLSANLALWGVDKALYELNSDALSDIMSTFWSPRYFGTTWGHSLEGIFMLGAEGGGCFTGETRISMADGTQKPIKNILPGEYVLTRESPSSPKTVKAKVNQTLQHHVGGYLIINGDLKVTPEHRLWLNNHWQQAQYAKVGDTLLDYANHPVHINSLEWSLHPTDVFNIGAVMHER